jgi:hypothetical protein
MHVWERAVVAVETHPPPLPWATLLGTRVVSEIIPFEESPTDQRARRKRAAHQEREDAAHSNWTASH